MDNESAKMPMGWLVRDDLRCVGSLLGAGLVVALRVVKGWIDCITLCIGHRLQEYDENVKAQKKPNAPR